VLEYAFSGERPDVLSDMTRFAVLSSIVHAFNEQLTEDEKKTMTRKIYCLSPRPYKHSDDGRVFLELPLTAALGVFWNKSYPTCKAKPCGYVNSKGRFVALLRGGVRSQPPRDEPAAEPHEEVAPHPGERAPQQAGGALHLQVRQEEGGQGRVPRQARREAAAEERSVLDTE
jgi:hypothetical protein